MTPYLTPPFATKKALKAHKSNPVTLIDPTPFGDKSLTNYTGPIVGPGPYDRKYYATVTVINGILTKVV